MSPNILFLNGRLPAYTVASMNTLMQVSCARLEVYYKPNSPDAPFQHRLDPRVELHARETLEIPALLAAIGQKAYDLVVVAGWVDKGYNSLAKEARKMGIPVMLIMDNQWHGVPKQWVAAVGSGFIRNTFSHCWVPGIYQFEYARRLGFDRNNILFHVYSADVALFGAIKKADIPEKRFVFTGRLAEEKGLKVLVAAADIYRSQAQEPWVVEMVGNGSLKPLFTDRLGFQLYPFMQPDALCDWASKGGVLVMPSLSEPWGVVVHEYALMGYPMVLSDAVGAASSFLKHNSNGFMFRSGSAAELADALLKISSLPEEHLLHMGEISKKLASKVSNIDWVHALNQVIDIGLYRSAR